MNKIPFTKKGYDDLVTELNVLKVKRISAVNNLKTAREMGDLSENAAYKVARSKLSSIDYRLRYLIKTIDNAYIKESFLKDVIEIGCTVVVEDNLKIKKTFQIVNSHESDVIKGKISYYSPVGKALVGKRLNEVVYIRIPNGHILYKIKEIKT